MTIFNSYVKLLEGIFAGWCVITSIENWADQVETSGKG